MQLNFKKVDSSNGNTNAGDILFVNNDNGIYIVESDRSKTKYGGSEYNLSNKLSADFIKDGSTNKVVTETEKTEWNDKQPGNLIVIASEDEDDSNNTRTTNYSVSDVQDAVDAGKSVLLQWSSLSLPLVFISSEFAIYCLTVAADSSLSSNMPTCVLSVVQRNNTATYTEYDFNSVAFTGETDPVFTASAAYGITAADITNWNNKVSNVQADWDATTGLAQILNKPTIPSTLDQIADGNTRKLSDYLPLAGGTMAGDSSIIIPSSYMDQGHPVSSVEIANYGIAMTNGPHSAFYGPQFIDIYDDDRGYAALNGDVLYFAGSGEYDIKEGIGIYYKNNEIIKKISSSTSYTLSIPNKTGTLAVTSDIPIDASVAAWGYLKANDVSTKADKSAVISSLSLNMDSSTYTVTLSGTMADGSTFTVSNPIDLPLESMVVNGSYNNSTKKVVLTLKNGSTVDFSVADLVNGLQSEITSSNKLSADLIQDGTTNKVVTATDKNKWNNLVSNVQSDWNATSGNAQILNKPTIPSTLDQITDGSTRKLSDYLPLTGGRMSSIDSSISFGEDGYGFTKISYDGITVRNGGYFDGNQIEMTDPNADGGRGGIYVTEDDLHGYFKNYDYTFPKSSGTVAFTSNIPTDSSIAGWGYIKTITDASISALGYTKNTGTLTGVKFNNVNATVSNGVASITANIPTVNDATLTIKKNGTSVGTFTANASTDTSVNITVNELPTVSGSDNGKILQVVNGQWTLVTPVSIYNGSGEPSNILGNNGDIYIQS